MRLWPKGIQFRILRIFLSLSITPLLVVAIVASTQGKKTLEERIGMSLVSSATHKIDEIDVSLYNGLRELKIWGKILADYQDPSRIQATLAQIKESHIKS